MKRCPECGFRAADHTCPLCGVRMRETAAPIKTHTHTQTGEKCALPNARQVPTAPRSVERAEDRPQRNSSRQQHRAKPDLGAVIFIIIVFILLRSCA